MAKKFCSTPPKTGKMVEPRMGVPRSLGLHGAPTGGKR